MTNETTIKDLYFNWMASLAIPNRDARNKFSLLLEYLNNTKFYFTIPLDENRSIDGLALRYRFGADHNIPDKVIFEMIDTKECSMLEMMVALALRGEEQIMWNPNNGNGLSVWVSEMIISLKLQDMTNDRFDEQWVKYRLDSLLNHDYEPNGEGGLFTISNPRKNLKTVQIWYQMCWYLDQILKNEKENFEHERIY